MPRFMFLSLPSAITFLAIALVVGAADAQFDGLGGKAKHVTANSLVSVEAVFDRSRIEPGETAQMVITFHVTSHWHLYWKNPGEGAAPPRFSISGPEGYEVGDVRWPRPIRLPSPVGDMFCYEDDVVFTVPVTRLTEASESDGPVEFTLDVDWAVCDKDRCLLGRQSLKVPLQVHDSAAIVQAPDQFAPRFPRPLEQVEGAEVSFDGSILRIRGPLVGDGALSLFPNPPAGAAYNDADTRIVGDRFEIDIPVTLKTELLIGTKPMLGGLIAMGPHRDDPSFEFSLPIEIPEQN